MMIRDAFRRVALAVAGLILIGMALLFGLGRSGEQCVRNDPITGRPAEVGTFWCQAR